MLFTLFFFSFLFLSERDSERYWSRSVKVDPDDDLLLSGFEAEITSDLDNQTDSAPMENKRNACLVVELKSQSSFTDVKMNAGYNP